MAKRPASLTIRPVGKQRKWSATSRGSRHQRGYGWEWEKQRKRILDRDRHLCQKCLREGQARPATDVDHVVSRGQGGSEGDDNLQALCRACHKAKTALEGQAGHHREQ
jgi:5-methylcytosine-specific restriction protein A